MSHEDMISEILERQVRTERQMTEILERVVRTETKIDGYNNLREKLDTTYGIALNNKEKITEIKDNTKWLWRTIAGFFLLGILGTLINFGIK